VAPFRVLMNTLADRLPRTIAKWRAGILEVRSAMTVELPPLLLTANVASVFEICKQLDEASNPVTCDASRLVVAEPMALCALVATLSRLQRFRREVRVVGLSPQFKRQLETLDILSRSLHVREDEGRCGYQGSLHAYRVKSEEEGNEVGNKIARSIASLVPSSRPPVSATEPVVKDHSLVFPLAYIFIELIDNGLRHGRGRGYGSAGVWIAAQYHSPRGLIRLAIADDGCGFLLTFQGREDLRIRSHADAIRAGFRPFTSSKRDVGLFADTQHQGLGLTICRDLALRSDGQISVVTGNSWMTNPEVSGEQSRVAPFWQGSVLSVELRLPALNSINFFEITNRYNPNPNLEVRII
jgi:signal transduction histidine kinase